MGDFKQAKRICVVLLAGLFSVLSVQAQYFGRNKVHYQTFDFDVHQTPNYDIYTYLKDDSLILDLASKSELWYKMHQAVLRDTIKFKNPILFYNNHAHFQQTRAIGGSIGVGTGGVTEGFKNRVVMPLTNSNFQTNHVLGHELVHAFQYNILRNTDSTSIQNSQNIPLWIIEGMAEYMSLGRFDPNTAMWMRDAVENDDIPTLKDLTTNPKYFPYRYGQAFWAFVTGKWGDQIIESLFKQTAVYGFEEGIQQTLNMTPDSLSMLWADEMREYYSTFLPDSSQTIQSSVLLGEDNSGKNEPLSCFKSEWQIHHFPF